jgi:uncharacterized membrane protein YkvA (DUF1232 family)
MPLTLSRAGLLAGLRSRERTVRERLWPKVKATLATVPFLDHVLAAYHAALDPRTPLRAKATLLGALVYFIAPVDVIPDVLAGFGFTDDFAVLMLAIRSATAHILPEHYDKARAWLAEAKGAADGARVTVSPASR